MSAIAYTPKASDLPNPARGQGGSFNELDVPGDYEVRLEAYEDYDNGRTNGWIFRYSCETPSGGSVEFPVYLPHSVMWKVVQHFDALGSPTEADVRRTYDPAEVVGRVAAAHIDFPRDTFGNPTSKYREIRFVFPLPDDAEIQELQGEDPVASTPEPVDLPDEVEQL
jgi:hypothetical protein